MTVNADDFALVVGINDYPNYRSLAGAIADAEDFAKWLLDDQTGGGVPATNLKKVLSQANPIHPIQDTIDEALDEIWLALGTRRGRRFYLYFSGHGLGRTAFGTDLCLAKWSDRRRNLALDSQDYANLIAESGKFDEVIFFLDCCRVRKVNTRGLPPTLGWARPDEGAGATRIFLGYATEFMDKAYEAEVQGGDEPLVRGHFTRALLAGLRGGAARETGGVTAESLKKYVETETPRIALAAGHQQKPVVTNGLPSVKDVVFGSAQRASNARIVFAVGRTGEVVLEDGVGNEIRRGDAAQGPWELSLLPANYALIATATGEEKLFRFRPSEGVTVVEF
jgi:hypothetical protein